MASIAASSIIILGNCIAASLLSLNTEGCIIIVSNVVIIIIIITIMIFLITVIITSCACFSVTLQPLIRVQIIKAISLLLHGDDDQPHIIIFSYSVCRNSYNISYLHCGLYCY